MKSFPYRILFFCIFLPPTLYILTLQGLESYLKGQFSNKLEKIIIQNYDALYKGHFTVKEEINRNIGNFLKRNFLHQLGVTFDILIKTKEDQILFPSHETDNLTGLSSKSSPSSDSSLDYIAVATDNYKLLMEGFDLSLDLRIRHNSWISNGILLIYIFPAVFVLQWLIRKKIKESEKYDIDQLNLIDELSTELRRAKATLEEVNLNESEYLDRIEILNKDKHELNRNIEDLLEEMETLEGGLKTQRELREKTEEKVLLLTEEINQIKDRPKKGKKKNKKIDTIEKRFKVLYKNLYLTERALDGFSSLTDDFQLKAEEIIHKLNEDDSQIAVKRKVFSKGGKINVLEVDFSYSGRLYFKKESSGKIGILSIGTKNTQEQDLNYLEKEHNNIDD